jgi:hypothetical protein
MANQKLSKHGLTVDVDPATFSGVDAATAEQHSRTISSLGMGLDGLVELHKAEEAKIRATHLPKVVDETLAAMREAIMNHEIVQRATRAQATLEFAADEMTKNLQLPTVEKNERTILEDSEIRAMLRQMPMDERVRAFTQDKGVQRAVDHAASPLLHGLTEEAIGPIKAQRIRAAHPEKFAQAEASNQARALLNQNLLTFKKSLGIEPEAKARLISSPTEQE